MEVGAADEVRLAPRSPREVAIRILADRFGEIDGAGSSGSPTFDLAAFQRDAALRAEAVLRTRRGVLVADSVGLGKTFVALALIETALRGGDRVLVTAPAALRREWRPRLIRLARRLGLGSAALAWVSHERLSRGGYAEPRAGGVGLVVVDEAHAFRSPRARRYRALARLCRGARIVLLSATPVNNSLWDLYFLLRLFAGDGDFRDLGVPDLREAFRAATGAAMGMAAGRTARGKSGAPAGSSTIEASAGTASLGAVPPMLLEALGAVTIRRTRDTLRRRYGEIRLPASAGRAAGSFPARAPPMPIRYALDDAVPKLQDRLLDGIASLEFAALRVAEYAPGDGPGSPGPVDLVRAGLCKRLESSAAAFHASVRRQVRFHRSLLDALEQGRLLTPTEHRRLHGTVADDVIQGVLADVVLRPAPPGLELSRLRADVHADLDRLRSLEAAIRPVTYGQADPKCRALIALSDRELRDRKVVVFTEYRETARHLWRTLRARGGVALVDGAGAFLGASPSGRRAVIERFAPRANRAKVPPPRERVRILIATDVLAEGLNLHDADRVISYDLPWNPVRLIQRIGRIDRLGSPFRVVYPYYFLPDRGLERVLGLLDRLRAKLTAIGRSVGREAAVLDEAGNVRLEALADRLAAGDPDALDPIERIEARPFERQERLFGAYVDAVRSGGAAPAGARGLRIAMAAREPAGSQESGDSHAPAGSSAPASSHAPGGSHAPGDSHRTMDSRCVPSACVYGPADARHRVLVAVRRGGATRWIVAELDGSAHPVVLPPGDAEAAAESILLAAFESAPDPGTVRPGMERPSTAPPDRDSIEAAIRAALRVASERVAADVASDAIAPRSANGAAARAVLRALAAMPGGASPDVCRRADAVLAALATARDAGTDAAIRRLVRRPNDGADPVRRANTLLTELESLLPRTGGSMPHSICHESGTGRAVAARRTGAVEHATGAAEDTEGAHTATEGEGTAVRKLRLIGVIELRPAAEEPAPQRVDPPSGSG